MAFTDLSTSLQVIENYNFEVFSKVFWIFLLISFSLIYRFWYIPFAMQKTPFYSLAVIRGLFHVLSVVNLISIPLLFFVMSPSYDMWTFIKPYFVLYTTGITIFMISVFRDFLVVGIPTVLRHGGLDFDDPNIVLAEKQIFKKNGKTAR